MGNTAKKTERVTKTKEDMVVVANSRDAGRIGRIPRATRTKEERRRAVTPRGKENDRSWGNDSVGLCWALAQ